MRSRVLPLPDTIPRRAQWFITVLVTAGLFIAMGCSNNPVSPVDGNNSSDLLALSSPARLSNNENCYEGSGLVTPEDGGVVQLGWAGPRNRLEFAPGAVDSDVFVEVTTCTVKGTAKNHYSALVLDFGPDHLTYDPPAKIVINAGSLNSLRSPKNGDGVVRLYYYDPDADEWLLQQEAKIEKGSITFSIVHFSKFGISH